MTDPGPHESHLVIVLADISGSMIVDGKLEALNLSLREMARCFDSEALHAGETLVGVVTFGGEEAQVALAPVPAGSFAWRADAAEGRTPMGRAFEVTAALAAAHAADPVPPRPNGAPAAEPMTLVLASDGRPTDKWTAGLAVLDASPRAAAASRFAVAIGADADRAVLDGFAKPAGGRVFEAEQTSDIAGCFASITLAVAADRRRRGDPGGTEDRGDQVDTHC